MSRAHLRVIVRDRPGNAIQNALLKFYLPGTTTPVTDAWTTATGGASIVQALTDDRGKGEAWFDAPQYVDVVITSNGDTAFLAGTTIRAAFADLTEANLEALPSPDSGGGGGGGLVDGSVTTPKLANVAVTTAKLADGAVTAAKVAADVATQAELDTAVATLTSSVANRILVNEPPLSAYRYNARADGTNQTANLQAWLNAIEGGEGTLPKEATPYRIDSPIYVRSNTLIYGNLAMLQAPNASAFSMVNVAGTSPARFSNVKIHDLVVDMRSTALALDNASGFELAFCDNWSLVGCKSINAGFEGFLYRDCSNGKLIACETDDVWGDSFHAGKAAVGEITENIIHIGCVARGRGNNEAGYAATGDQARQLTYLGCHAYDHHRGYGISGAHDLVAIGGTISNCATGLHCESVDYGGGNIDETYDALFSDILIRGIGATAGISAYRANRTNSTRPITFRNIDVDGGANLTGSFDGCGLVVVDNCTLRTTSRGIDFYGDVTFPGMLTRIFRTRVIGASTAFYRQVSAANAGVLQLDPNNTYDTVTDITNDPTWPLTTGDDSGWINLTAVAGWTVTTLRYRKLNGRVDVDVFISNSSGVATGAPSTLTTTPLPVGFRPSAITMNNGYGRVRVLTDGTIQAFDVVTPGDGLIVTVSFFV